MNNNYPSQINPLTGARFFAALWLLLYFFLGRVDLPVGFEPKLIENGYLGVDLFFILSGFVLAHVYGPQMEENRYSHTSFLWARLARVYPLHFATLFMMLGLFGIAIFSNADFDVGAFSIEHLPYHLTLTHAWGLVDADSWNFPSWSISSEWFAYISFPLMFLIASKFKNNPILGVLFACVIFYVLYAIAAYRNTELTNMTWEGGVVRIIPSFLAGIALWFLGRKNIVPSKFARAGTIASFVLLLIVNSIGHYPTFVWPLLLALVFFIAETSKTEGKEIIGSKIWVYLGEISFSMYMIHLPIDIVYFRLVEEFIKPDGLIGSLLVVFGALILTIISAAIAHALIEKPMREFLRKQFVFRKVERNEILPSGLMNFSFVRTSK